MELLDLSILCAVALMTAVLSAVVGMAGGITLLSVMLLFFDPLVAIPVHGVVQLVSNGSRTYIQREHVEWWIFHRYAAPLIPMGFVGIAIAQALLYLASVPKSNAAYKAFGAAMEHVRNTPSYPVPMHLRNAPTALMKNMGYGKDYRYAHDEEDAFAAGEVYFPTELQGQVDAYYVPTERGLEAKIKARLERLNALNTRANPRSTKDVE